MEIMKCIYCMEDMKPQDEFCPCCGKKRYSSQNPEYALKAESILHGKYLIGAVLGQGGFGITYIGYDLVLNLKVAIKEYYPSNIAGRNSGKVMSYSYAANEFHKGCENFLNEARKMAKVDNVPSVVRVREFFFENNTAYIVMDYIEGITLRDLLKRNGPMPYEYCVNLMWPVLIDLEKVHNHGMIHRDIKPDNLMIRKDGSLVLLDLGAAKDMDIQNAPGEASAHVVSRGFSPAEQYIDSGMIGPWTDIYAIAATMYYSLTGKVPQDVLSRLKHDEMDFSEQTMRSVPRTKIAVLQKAMALSEADRYQNMWEFRNALTAVGGKVPAGTGKKANPSKTPVTPPVSQMNTPPVNPAGSNINTKKKKKSPLPKILIGVGAAAAAVVIGVVALGGSSGDHTEVVKLGQINENIANEGQYLTSEDGNKLYLIGQDFGLYLITADDEEEAFYIDNYEKLADDATELTQGEGSIYFCGLSNPGTIYGVDEETDKVTTVYDGSNDVYWLQYAELSDGHKYLYYMDYTTDQIGQLHRYDLDENSDSLLLSEEGISWFNLYQDKIYYTALNDNTYTVRTCSLAGDKAADLITTGNYSFGFADDDFLCLYSRDTGNFDAFGLDGSSKECQALADMEIETFTTENHTFYAISYYDGCFYYVSKSDDDLHKVNMDGSGDTVIASDVKAGNINYQGDLYVTCLNNEEESQECQFIDVNGNYRLAFDGGMTTEVNYPEAYANLSSGGFIASDEDNTIMALNLVDGGLSTINQESQEYLQPAGFGAKALNLVDETFYFIKEDGSICSMNSDGTNLQTIFSCDTPAENLFVTDSAYYIMFALSDGTYEMCRLDRADTSTAKYIFGNVKSPSTIFLYNSHFYYANTEDGCVHAIQLDGTNDMVVTSHDVDGLIVNQFAVYGYNESEYWYSNLDGSNENVTSLSDSGLTLTGMIVNDDGTGYYAVNGSSIGIMDENQNWFFQTDSYSRITDLNTINDEIICTVVSVSDGTSHTLEIESDGTETVLSYQ